MNIKQEIAIVHEMSQTLHFMDIVGKKMGTWKCKGTTAVIKEAQKISLSGLLNEQGSEVTSDVMDSYVDAAVDDLDGYVAEYNLKNLQNKSS